MGGCWLPPGWKVHLNMGHTHEKPIQKLPAGLAAGSADQSLLSSTILMARVLFGGGVGGFASHGTLGSFLGLVSFIYFLGLVCLFPCLMCLPSPSKWKCFNVEKITTGQRDLG